MVTNCIYSQRALHYRYDNCFTSRVQSVSHILQILKAFARHASFLHLGSHTAKIWSRSHPKAQTPNPPTQPRHISSSPKASAAQKAVNQETTEHQASIGEFRYRGLGLYGLDG